MNELFKLFPKREEIPDELNLGNFQHGRDYLIDGQIKTWDGPCRDIHSPVLVQHKDRLRPMRITQGAMLTRREALDALDAAVRAYDNGMGEWPNMTIFERIQRVRLFIEKMISFRDRIALLEMWEIAKTLDGCKKEFDRTVSYLEKTVDLLERAEKEASSPCFDGSLCALVKRVPLGVELCMGPFNVPLFETLCTAIPALLMGNTTVIKLPRHGVLSLLALLPLFREFFPRGVVNIIDGDGQKVVTPIMESGDVALLSFIGSSRVANIIRRAHPHPNRLRKVLGLDAKNPAIVLEDADINKAAEDCVYGAFAFNGQRCTALKHIWVHQSIQEDFLKSFCQKVDELKIGMPWENAQITPLAEFDKPAWLGKLLEDAKNNGGKVVNDGGQHRGTLFSPAVLFPVNEKMEISHVEQFGPIAPVSSFVSIDEVIQFIRASKFGQQASIFGANPKKIGKLIDLLSGQVSRININTYASRSPDSLPFTGRKDSGESVLSITESLRTFSSELVLSIRDEELELMEKISKEGHSRYLRNGIKKPD